MTGQYLFDNKEKQIQRINDTSFFHHTSKKFLTLSPSFICFDPNSSSPDFLDLSITEIDLDSCSDLRYCPSLIGNYLNYLNEAHQSIQNSLLATSSWSRKYDAQSFFNLSNHCNISSTDSGIYIANNSQVNSSSPLLSPPLPSYLASSSSSTSAPTLSHSNQNLEIDSNLDLISNEAEIIGPFLSNLFSRLAQMPLNDFYINLQLTGLVSRLAIFSQPLLRSFLFNDKLKFHKNVRSLLNIIIEVKLKFEQLYTSIDKFDVIYRQAKFFVNAREKILYPLSDTFKAPESDSSKTTNVYSNNGSLLDELKGMSLNNLLNF